MPIGTAAVLAAIGIGFLLSQSGNYETISYGGERFKRLKTAKREALYKGLTGYVVVPVPGPWPNSSGLACQKGSGPNNLWAFLVMAANTADIGFAVQDIDAILAGKSPATMTGYMIPHSLAEELTADGRFALVLGPDVLSVEGKEPAPTAQPFPGVVTPPGPSPIPPDVSLPGTMPGTIPGTLPVPGMPGSLPTPVVPGLVPEDGMPASPAVFDANMSETDRNLTYQLFMNSATTPEAFDIAEKGFTLRGYPIAAEYARKRAAWLRSHKQGTTPQPPTGVPPTSSATMVVRNGHIPWKVGKYYTGDPNRWRELLPANADKNMHTETKNGTTLVVPWYDGLTINLPDSWKAYGRPPPAPSDPSYASKGAAKR